MSDYDNIPPYTHKLYMYLYLQWKEDDNLDAFVKVHNETTDKYLDEIRKLNIPNYKTKNGKFLDYVAKNLYGISRKPLLNAQTIVEMGINIDDPNTISPNDAKILSNSFRHEITDIEFRKIIEWNVYREDGFHFTIPWLKRRLSRFLSYSSGDMDMNSISIVAENRKITIRLLNDLQKSPYRELLKGVLLNKTINLPFMFEFELEDIDNA
ncbi:hypothetical protein [Commensalibacter melissae]|uniref:hypothetical protein n=1 Tax=Commensalibacter melissae TaxID=2070537 RepID=UPI0018C2E9D1|nr:hypothetical protein [Commensalibacter melissae]